MNADPRKVMAGKRLRKSGGAGLNAPAKMKTSARRNPPIQTTGKMTFHHSVSRLDSLSISLIAAQRLRAHAVLDGPCTSVSEAFTFGPPTRRHCVSYTVYFASQYTPGFGIGWQVFSNLAGSPSDTRIFGPSIKW